MINESVSSFNTVHTEENMKKNVLSKISVITVIFCIVGAVCSVIYISSIYKSILTSMPLWMINVFIVLIWVLLATVVLVVCFVLKKHYKD